MSGGGVFSNQAIGGLAVRDLDPWIVRVGGPVRGAKAVAPAQEQSPPPAPPRGADEPGKGRLVDVTA